MKKFIFNVFGFVVAGISLVFLTWYFFVPKPIMYDVSMGYDFNRLGYNKAVVKIYHSNTSTNHWGLLQTLEVDLDEKTPSFDFQVIGDTNKVSVLLNYITPENTGNQIVYHAKVLGQAEVNIDGFSGELRGFRKDELVTTTKEQLYLVYPISNSESAGIYTNVSLDKPYDEMKTNLDNILITLTLQK